MTAVPRETGAVLLICDRCGDEEIAGHPAGLDDLVWPAVTSRGWAGSPFATGDHRCPPCSLQEPDPGPAHGARPPSASYDVRARTDTDVVVFTPLTDLDFDLAERMRDELMSAAAHHRHVVLDMHAVDFIDSTGLGLLVRARQEARRHQATLDLLAPTRFLLTVLHTMRLDGIFRTFPDLETALQDLCPPVADHRGA